MPDVEGLSHTTSSPDSESSSFEFVDATAALRVLHEISCAATETIRLPEDIYDNLQAVLDYLKPDASPTTSNASSPNRSRLSSPLPSPASGVSTPTVSYDIPITRKRTLRKLYRYDLDAYVEYPETCTEGEIGHLFRLDPHNWVNPRENLSYSQGQPMGQTLAHQPVLCKVLVDDHGQSVPCTKGHSTCQGCKVCPKGSIEALLVPHTQANRDLLKERLELDSAIRAMSNSNSRIVFERTAGYMHAIMKLGCGARLVEPTLLTPEERTRLDAHVELQSKARRGQMPSTSQCEGRLFFNFDEKGDAFISCEHYHSISNRDHFLDYAPSKGALDTDYLEALFAGDSEEVTRIEQHASDHGYGPLASCGTVTNFSSQRLVCPCDHRSPEGRLEHLEMIHLSCHSKFTVFTPLEAYRQTCPFVLIVCSGAHEHPVPLPTTTPPSVKREVFHMLRGLGQDLPDATPRRVMRHGTIRARLRQLLPELADPSLSDLHVSLANKDHLRRYISVVKLECFPHGTGWEGAQHLKEVQDQSATAEPYVRFVGSFEPHEIEGGSLLDEDGNAGEAYRFVVCMTPHQSMQLSKAHYLQSDIAFRRVAGYEEFEIGGWDADNKLSMCYCRVFVNRQCAAAHCFLFARIEEIVLQDTGVTLQWRHLHSPSLDIPIGVCMMTVDEHLGQAKGLGRHFHRRAQEPDVAGRYDLHDPNKLLAALTIYEHLHRILRLCNVHVHRKIKVAKVSELVKNLMRGLMCLTHEDWSGSVARICSEGGKPGTDWVNHKLNGKWAFEAMCWEKSAIPLGVWQAGERHSNLIESLHADVNREGTGCTLVGGIEKGRLFDLNRHKAVTVLRDTGIRHTYKSGMESERMARNIRREQNARHRAFSAADAKISLANTRLQDATRSLALKRSLMDPAGDLTQTKKARRTLELTKRGLERAEKAHCKAQQHVEALANTGSGQVGRLQSQEPGEIMGREWQHHEGAKSHTAGSVSRCMSPVKGGTWGVNDIYDHEGQRVHVPERTGHATTTLSCLHGSTPAPAQCYPTHGGFPGSVIAGKRTHLATVALPPLQHPRPTRGAAFTLIPESHSNALQNSGLYFDATPESSETSAARVALVSTRPTSIPLLVSWREAPQQPEVPVSPAASPWWNFQA